MLAIFFSFARNTSATKQYHSSLMSSSSTPNTFPSFNGDELKAYIQSAVREALGPQPTSDQERVRDQQVAPPVVTELYTPSAEERERFPAIWPDTPQDFFQGGRSADEWNNVLRPYPKNTRALYDAPALPPVLQCTAAFKSHDSQLAKIQQDLAHLTRPIDAILHQIGTAVDLPAECEELVANFACLMRDRLAALAGKISDVRSENLFKDRGIPTSDSTNLLVDPHAFNERIKTAKALAAAFAPPKSNQVSSNGRNKSDKQGYQQQSRGRQGKGSNPDKRGYDTPKGYRNGSRDNDDNDRGRSSFHGAKGKETRRSSRHRGRSSSRHSSGRQ